MILDSLQLDYGLVNADYTSLGGGGGDSQTEPDQEECAGYDGDGDGENDAVPAGIDQMRDEVAAHSDYLRSLSDTAFLDGAVEFGAFLIRDASGDIRMSQPFTSGDSEQIKASDIEVAAQASMGPGDTLVGFVHTQKSSGTADASLEDALATAFTFPNVATNAGASADPNLMNYIIGPNGEVNEYTREAMFDQNRADNGKDLEEARNGGSCD